MRKNTNNVQRFLTYFIDFTIIGFIVSFISKCLYPLFNFDPETVGLIYNKLTEHSLK